MVTSKYSYALIVHADGAWGPRPWPFDPRTVHGALPSFVQSKAWVEKEDLLCEKVDVFSHVHYYLFLRHLTLKVLLYGDPVRIMKRC